MSIGTIDVSCFFCHTPNRVQIGTDFYEARAWYICYACKRHVSIHVTQTALLPHLPDSSLSDIQIGEEIPR